MSKKKLLSTLDKSERIFENLSQNGLERIAKMQNLSQNELKQITKMSNISQNELQQIAKMRLIKNYKNMSREKLLIALLKSEQSHEELYQSKSNNAKIEETKNFFNEIRNEAFQKSVIKMIRKKLYEIERGLESEEKRERKKHAKELKGIKKHFEKLKEKIKINYYKPIRTKDAFNNNYIEYESKGDKDKNLSPEDYLNIIRPFFS